MERGILMDKKKLYRRIIFGIFIFNIIFALRTYYGIPTEARIIQEKGYTIKNQEPYPITLSIPENSLTEAAYTEEGQVFRPVVTVFEEENTVINLTHIQRSEDSNDELYFEFSVFNGLAKNGSMILPYWVREDGKLVWNSFINDDLNTTDLVVDGVSYSDVVSMRSGDQAGKFVLRIKKDVCDLKGGKIEIPVTANKLFYAKGEAANEPETYTEEKVIRILKSHRNAALNIIDCVLVPESEYDIMGVVLYKDIYGKDEDFEISFVKADDIPRTIYMTVSNLTGVYDLEYIGNETVTYVTETQKGELKQRIKEQITLEESEDGRTNFIQEIVAENMNEIDD